jgi:MFS family permease
LSPAGQTIRFYRPFMPMFGGIFFCLFGVGASLATLPFYVLQQLHGSKVEVGIVVAGISVAAVVSRPVAGRFADTRGYKWVMIIHYAPGVRGISPWLTRGTALACAASTAGMSGAAAARPRGRHGPCLIPRPSGLRVPSSRVPAAL